MRGIDMIKELNQQIIEINQLIKKENDSIKNTPEFLQKIVLPKKQAIIESLNKQVIKLQTDIQKLEEKEKQEFEKEKREAPYKKILTEINSLKLSVMDKERILAQAKGLYQTNRDQNKASELNLKYKQANEDYFKAKIELENKLTESKILKENLKGAK